MFQFRVGGRVNIVGRGRGGGEGNGREGLERQLGELKYVDGEMCECLEKGKIRILGNEGGWGAVLGIIVEDAAEF